MASQKVNRYTQILIHIFQSLYRPGDLEVDFEREQIAQAARALGFSPPKNLGDVVYTYRYRKDMPIEIASGAPHGKEWIILPRGSAHYSFYAVESAWFVPTANLATIKVPDATPGIITNYVMTSEQALLAKVRYNRLIDLFTGIVCYSLQNHLRTQVQDIGQVETDEIYLGVDGRGAQFVVPVEAKGGEDRLSVVQVYQDFALCKRKFPGLVALPVGAQFVDDDVALFLFEEDPADGLPKVIEERRFRLVPPDQITEADLVSYRSSLPRS